MYVLPIPKEVTKTVITDEAITTTTITPIVGRGLSLEMREAKLQDLWKQLDVLESLFFEEAPNYFLPNLSLADVTVFPTIVYMEYYLVRVFDWSTDNDLFFMRPKLKSWFQFLSKHYVAFTKVKKEMIDELNMSETVQADIISIKEDIASEEGRKRQWKGFGK